MEEKTTIIDMHKHGFEKVEFEKANLLPMQYIRSLLANAQIYNVKIQTCAGSHNSTTWGRAVYNLFNQIAEKFPEIRNDLDIIPQSEFNVDIGRILTYPDTGVGGEKYVFKKLHILVAPKKGREEEYFEKTDIFSRWTDMFIDISNPDLRCEGKFPQSQAEMYNKYIYVGAILKACRNILCRKYCTNENRIPFEVYRNTVKPGLTYEEIRNRFIQDSFEYLVSQGLIDNTWDAREKLAQEIEKFKAVKYGSSEPVDMLIKPEEMKAKASAKMSTIGISVKEETEIKVHHAVSRLQLNDIKLLFGDSSYICVAHPNTIEIRNHSGIPASAFLNVNISSLPYPVQDQIIEKLNDYYLTGEDYIFKLDDGTGVLSARERQKTGYYNQYDNTEIYITGDKDGLVKDEIVLRRLDEYTSQFGFTIDAVEITPNMFVGNESLDERSAWRHLDLYTELGKAVNCNSSLGDVHMNQNNDLSLIDRDRSRWKNQRTIKNSTYYCTHCSWIDLLKNGTFDPNTQSVSIKVISDKFDKVPRIYNNDYNFEK